MVHANHSKAPDWLYYELLMLFNSCGLRDYATSMMGETTGPDQEGWRTISTCALESFLIHYRIIKEFLNNQRFEHDVKAKDYSSSWNGTSNNLETYKDEDKRINRLLAHLSYDRGALNPGQWDTASMQSKIQEEMREYLKNVDSEHIGLFKRHGDLLSETRRQVSTPVGEIDNSTATVQSFVLFGEWIKIFPPKRKSG